MRDFHVRRDARDRYAIDGSVLTASGDIVTMDVPAIRRITARINAARREGAPAVSAGEVAALGLLHEVGHLVIRRYRESATVDPITDALTSLEQQLGPEAHRLLDRFAEEFPDHGPETDPESDPQTDRVEELILTRLANENPAIGPLRELVDDRRLERETRYREAIAGLDVAFADGAPVPPEGGSLLDVLRAPALHAPTSLSGQLQYIRAQWPALLGEDLEALATSLDLTLGILAEEARALHLRFGGGAPGRAEPPALRGPDGAPDEPEAFSSDAAWMPRVVLMAKSTYVWLDQLSRAHGRDIRTLDGIPDEELDTIAHWGVTGLWLIGLWERSAASERIKRMRGNLDAVASAYSLDDYRIADDLGGEAAYADLRDRAAARGIRLASDMVPNHMGIDSSWVIEHPEWFLSLDRPPYPAYTFSGPDLSSDERIGIVLEDHYWNDSDAAVVFKRFDRQSGEERYIYHGNDGTSFPWNDTAQLDFLDRDVRERVIQAIVGVAKHFPIIRFDAAMVLAKKHIERLWWPEPGTGGGIPSRAEFGTMRRAEFDERMPVEFWREVVDRVAAEVPDTLLLAEAFWLLEGYFVRTLGMHRVYNSAFMHMLRDEDGAGYRTVLKETLEFDPEILKRYVNFMSNPDEETALEQFGKDDKYFGVATVLATLPGLPMLGHGQVQGFSEKYGMEFRRATREESPDPWLVQRHERELFPLLHRRAWFAEARQFLLYDVLTDDGSVAEDVFAYSNGSGSQRSVVLYHNRSASVSGWIRSSVPYAVKSADGSKKVVQRSLVDALGIPDDSSVFVAFRDARTGLESIRSAAGMHDRGLHVSLGAYEAQVLWELRELRDGAANQWSRVAARLGQRAVVSLDDALRELQLEPAHTLFRALFDDGSVGVVLDGRPEPSAVDALEGQFRAFLEGLTGVTGAPGDPRAVAAAFRRRLEVAFAGADAPRARPDRAALLGWLAVSRTGELATGADAAPTSRAWYDELALSRPLTAGMCQAGLDEGEARDVADRVRTLLAVTRPSAIGGPDEEAPARLLEAWLADATVRAAIGVNTWEGLEWVDRERLAALLDWAIRLDALEASVEAERHLEGSLPGRGSAPARDRRGAALVARLMGAAEAAGYRVDRLMTGLAPPQEPTGPDGSRDR